MDACVSTEPTISPSRLVILQRHKETVLLQHSPSRRVSVTLRIPRCVCEINHGEGNRSHNIVMGVTHEIPRSRPSRHPNPKVSFERHRVNADELAQVSSGELLHPFPRHKSVGRIYRRNNDRNAKSRSPSFKVDAAEPPAVRDKPGEQEEDILAQTRRISQAVWGSRKRGGTQRWEQSEDWGGARGRREAGLMYSMRNKVRAIDRYVYQKILMRELRGPSAAANWPTSGACGSQGG